MSTKTAAALVLALTHTTQPGSTSATVTKITKATVFVELESGAAERFNRATGKRVGGNYKEGDLLITPADLQRIAAAEAAESTPAAAPAAPAPEPEAPAAEPQVSAEEAERAEAAERAKLETEARLREETARPAPAAPAAEQDDEEEPGEGAPASTPRPKGELRIDTREIVDTAARVGRAATRCRKQAEFFEAVGTASALTVAAHLRTAQKAYEQAAELAPKVKLASKEGGPAAPKGFVPGATVRLNDAGAKVFAGVLTTDQELTVKTNRGRVIECASSATPAPLFIERRYLVAATAG